MRIGDVEDPLDSGCHGPVYAAHYRVRRPPRHRGWSGAVRDVPLRDWRTRSAEISQLRSRSAVSLPPMGSESPSTRGKRNQDCSLRAAFASLCRATDRYDSARVSRPPLIPDHSRSGSKAKRVSALLQLQRLSNSCRAGRTPARAAGWSLSGTHCDRSVPVAQALSRLVPNSDSRLNLSIRHAQVAQAATQPVEFPHDLRVTVFQLL